MQLKKRVLSGMAVGLVAVSSAVATAPSSQAAISFGCGFTSSQPTLRYGNYGLSVQQAQCEVSHTMLGVYLDFDGSFGPATLAAIKKFQGCAHLVKDGIVGPNTWSALNYWTSSTGFVC